MNDTAQQRDIVVRVGKVQVGLFAKSFFKVMELVLVMEVLDRLLQADGDKQADADGADVDEEVFPRVGRRVGRVDVEHGFVLWDSVVLTPHLRIEMWGTRRCGPGHFFSARLVSAWAAAWAAAMRSRVI